ncbi:acyl-CoA reductase [Streptomyces virginiae]|uniref:acyl-CoA reductase n=1 Tax=Streptomyces virginiae TaxID=1961 RepID=UPI00099D89F5|nr:acyl-CoA reductase [Streptomyces virginiae]
MIVDLPIIVCGELRYPTGLKPAEVIDIEYSGGITIRLPRLTESDIDQILSSRVLLQDMPLAQITQYISNAGTRWANPADALRQQAVELASQVTGYSKEMISHDYANVGGYLMFRNNLYDLLDSELGDHHLLEEWTRNQVAKIRAFPRGRVLHVLVGNVPMAGVFSLVRSILTKNQTIAKLPARDVVSALKFGRMLLESNPPDHPVSQTLTIAYWDRDESFYDRIIQASDLVCAWGNGSSLEALKHRLPHSIPYVEFGPKRSYAVVFADEVDTEAAALRIAHDMSVYDQEACFSPQRLFVIGDHQDLVFALRRKLDEQAEILPKGASSNDINAHIVRSRLEARYHDWEVIEGADWTLAVSDNPYVTPEHPLARTLFVHPISDLSALADLVDDETQTVSVLPHSRAVEVADFVCSRGAVRVCETGMVAHFRQGFTHDGSNPLRTFVRIAHIDESIEHSYKYGDVWPVKTWETYLFGAHREEQGA